MPLPYEPRKLALATLGALVVAAAVLVVAVLPAEYGVDPTGLGRTMGFRALSDERPARASTWAEEWPDALYEMRASWRLVDVPLAQTSGATTMQDRESRVEVPVEVANLTSVTARLSWTDDDLVEGRATDGDTFELSIRAPGGQRSQLVQAKNAPGQPGELNVTLHLASVPYPSNDGGALRLHAAPDTTGVGEWTFVVRLYAAGGVEGSESRDPGEDWTLAVAGVAYELELREDASPAGDVVRLTLAPRQGVEYKLLMDEGERVTYSWTASAPVHADLHGDVADDPDRFVSARIARLAEDSGEYVAPFEGRHGWFFRNDGDTTVTITLALDGDYRILGVV